MKRTLGLLGLFFVGIGLLFNPVTGVVGTSEFAPVAIPSTVSVVTTGEPPPEPDPTIGTATSAPTTTTTEAPGADAEPMVTTTVTTTSGSLVTVTGPAIETEWGSFQVAIIVEDGALVAVDALQEPGDRRSRRINARALPIYEELAIEAQSADIDVISGATVTWQGYTASLRAALEEVGLG
jgi:uncharacterized protein with FMN-binding domain